MDWNWLIKTFDPYERQARIIPALIVVLPLILVINALTPEIFSGSGLFFTAIGIYLGIALMATIVRDSGRRVEQTLFKEWGGIPTTQLLQHKDTNIEVQTKQRYHKFLQSHITDLVLPNAEEEKNHPDKANDAYASAVSWLREQTRDTKIFSLVFAENCSYGFRRNLFGMKQMGIVLSILSFIVSISTILDTSGIDTSSLSSSILLSIAVSLILLLYWFLIVKSSWVKEARFAYAYRLLAACDILITRT